MSENDSSPIFTTIFDELGDEADDDMRQIINNFVENWLPETMGKINEACDNKEWELLREIIHSLKGCAGGFGYMILTDFARETEDHIKAGEFEVVPGKVKMLNKLCNRVYLGFKTT